MKVVDQETGAEITEDAKPKKKKEKVSDEEE